MSAGSGVLEGASGDSAWYMANATMLMQYSSCIHRLNPFLGRAPELAVDLCLCMCSVDLCHYVLTSGTCYIRGCFFLCSGGSRVWKGGFHAHVHSSNHAPF